MDEPRSLSDRSRLATSCEEFAVQATSSMRWWPGCKQRLRSRSSAQPPWRSETCFESNWQTAARKGRHEDRSAPARYLATHGHDQGCLRSRICRGIRFRIVEWRWATIFCSHAYGKVLIVSARYLEHSNQNIKKIDGARSSGRPAEQLRWRKRYKQQEDQYMEPPVPRYRYLRPYLFR